MWKDKVTWMKNSSKNLAARAAPPSGARPAAKSTDGNKTEEDIAALLKRWCPVFSRRQARRRPIAPGDRNAAPPWYLDLLLIAGLCAVIVGVLPGDRNANRVAQRTSDEELTHEVTQAITHDVGFEAAARIHVDTKDGVVVLSGEAGSPSVRVRAAVGAGNVLDVRRVENHLALR